MSDPFVGKTVLITGAASGIGRALAERASSLGASLTLADIDGPGVCDLAAALGAPARLLDVGDPEAWRRLGGQEEPWDFVSLNAGIMSAGPDAPFDESDILTIDLDRYRKVLAVNLDGVVFGLRTVIPKMQDRGGAIVATASAAGVIPYPPDATYALTKHAVVGLIRSVAGALDARNAANPGAAIRVSAICPGGVRTNMLPTILRDAPVIMDPGVLVEEIVDLWLHGDNGEIRARIKADEPAWKIEPPHIELV